MAKKKNQENENLETENTVKDTQTSSPSFEELLELSEKKANEYKDMAQRIQAEFENYKKRNVDLARNSRLDATLDTVKEYLPIIDNFERAVSNIADENIKNGIALILKQFLAVFEKLNVKEIECLNCDFDPSLHNAIMQVETEDAKGKVVEVFQKGYIKDGKVLRYAMVKVGV